MKKLDAVKRIIEQFDLLPYREQSARYVRVGPYKISYQRSGNWTMTGKDLVETFSTRMGAMGYARCLQMNDNYTANQIKRLDEQAGSLETHMKSIAKAVDDNNDPLVAKQQQAEQRHREHMQSLARLVLNVLD
jgi:hypothetical protein